MIGVGRRHAAKLDRFRFRVEGFFCETQIIRKLIVADEVRNRLASRATRITQYVRPELSGIKLGTKKKRVASSDSCPGISAEKGCVALLH